MGGDDDGTSAEDYANMSACIEMFRFETKSVKSMFIRKLAEISRAAQTILIGGDGAFREGGNQSRVLLRPRALTYVVTTSQEYVDKLLKAGYMVNRGSCVNATCVNRSGHV